MAEGSIEVVQGHIEAYARRDVSTALSFLDPHVVLDVGRVGVLDSEAAYGHQAVADTVAGFVGAFEEYSYSVERLTDLGAGAVLAIASEAGLGKGSGVRVGRPVTLLYTVIDGKIARITVFPSEGEALEAVEVTPTPDL